MSPVNLQLKKFDPKKMGDDRICVFIGKRNTGKSYLIRDIMYHKKHIPTGIVPDPNANVINHNLIDIDDVFIKSPPYSIKHICAPIVNKLTKKNI